MQPGLILLYIDPATGSVAWQVIIGGVLAGATTLRLYWRRIKSVLGRRTAR